MDPETKTKIKAVQEVLPHLSSSDIEALLPRQELRACSLEQLLNFFLEANGTKNPSPKTDKKPFKSNEVIVIDDDDDDESPSSSSSSSSSSSPSSFPSSPPSPPVIIIGEKPALFVPQTKLETDTKQDVDQLLKQLREQKARDKQKMKKEIPLVENTRSTRSPYDERGGRKLSAPTQQSVSNSSSAAQLKEIQKKRKREYESFRGTTSAPQFAKKRVYTLQDLEKKRIQDFEFQMSEKGGFGKGTEMEKIGKEALKYTNEFRSKNGLPSLKWSPSLFIIATKHSINMGKEKVPFGHDGFQERMKEYPFSFSSFAENVAMNGGYSEVAKVSVNGWIDSPGHCKNLKGRFSECAIGVYRSPSSKYYLTQLFALT